MRAQKCMRLGIGCPERPPPKAVGHIRGVRVGEVFNGRGELAALGIHGQIGCGIDALKGWPCFCIVMSGGYSGDEDSGENVWYTGQGGRCPKSKLQIEDQTLTKVCTAADEKSTLNQMFVLGTVNPA